MDTNIVPVTENDMREFFGRVVTSFVSLSAQADELQRVKTDMDSLNARLNDLSTENGKLKASEGEAWQFANRADDERQTAIKAQQEAEAKAQHIQEVMVARDNRVADLEGELAKARSEGESERNRLQQALTQSQDDAEMLRAANHRLVDDNNYLKQQLETSNHDLQDATTARDEAIESLRKVRTALGIVPTPPAIEAQSWPHAVSG